MSFDEKVHRAISNMYKQGFADLNLKHVSLSLVCIIIVTRRNDRAFDSPVTILGIFDKHFQWESILWQCQNTHTHTHSHTLTHVCIYGGSKAHSPNMKVGRMIVHQHTWPAISK